MVSQSSSRQDSPVDPWEGVSDDPGDTDGLPSLLDTEHPSCPSDIRFTRHKAAWINPPYAVQVGGRTISSNSFSPEAFVLPVDVEKENAHFYVADMIISIMEKMKCNILSQQHSETWSTEEASRPLGSDQADLEGTFYTHVKQESGSSTSSDSGYEGCAVLQVSPVVETPTFSEVTEEDCKCDFDDFVIVELGDFTNTTEPCGCSFDTSKSVIHEPNFNSAELIAKELYRVFKKCWMLAEVHYQLAGSLDEAGSI
ncbi:hypothetical protein Celaphus_00016528, partial [Cervus elaphus hippelaphus]